MADLRDYDYTNFLIDPTLKDQELITRMGIFPEFDVTLTADLNKAKVIRYIALMYDMASEMGLVFPDLFKRKLGLAEMVNFKKTKQAGSNRFHPDVSEMLIGQNDKVNSMIIRYVRLFPDPDYVTYVSYQSMLLQQISLSMTATDAKIVKEIRQNVSGLNKDIAVLAERIFRGDTSRDLIKKLYSSMEEEKIGLRPEDVAAALRDGKLKIGSGQYEG